MPENTVDEAVDFEELKRLFARIPPGPYDALHRQDGWEVRQIDTDPGNKHHWPYRLCERIAGQTAECDDAVFPFIAAMLNVFPALLSEREKTKGAVEALRLHVPAGWRAIAVPPEPTELMVEAGREHNHQHNSEANMVESFKAMLMQAEIEAFALSTLTQEKTNVG